MMEKGLYMLLAADTGTSALVGSNIYFILQPKGTGVPSIVLSITVAKDFYTFKGVSGLRSALIQVDAYASNYYDVRATSRAVRLLLEGYMGNLPDADATAVGGCIVEKDWDMPFEAGQKGFIYRALLEVRMYYYDTSLPISTPSNPIATVDGGSFNPTDSDYSNQ
jgi:hypothetical protein